MAKGSISRAQFNKVVLAGAADFACEVSRTTTGFDAQITGAYLNAGPLMESLLNAPANDAAKVDDQSTLKVQGRLDRLTMRAGAEFRDAALDLLRVGDQFQTLDVSALTAEGKQLSLMLKRTGADNGPAQIVEGRSGDVGALLAGAFGVSSIRGGEGSLEIEVLPRDQGGGLTGQIEARGMRVVKAPLLARVFAAGSLTGLADLMNGEGIELSRASAKFGVKHGDVLIEEARATGPSVGITGAGRIASGPDGSVNLSGAVAPAYQVNSILGKTPILGEIFVNREGEGLVALSYDVSGSVAAPTVSVNPLSALAPGVFRRMFEGGHEKAAAPATTSNE